MKTRSGSAIRLALTIVLVAAVAYMIYRATREPLKIGPDLVDGAVLELVSELGFDIAWGLEDWTEMSFAGHSQYSLETDESGGSFVKASSKDACSGIFKKIEVSMEDRPHLSWEWRVTKFPQKRKDASLTEKSDCDFAARVCAVFAGDTPFSSHYIYYVWDDRFPEGTKAGSSGLLKRTQIIVVQYGAASGGAEWVSETRDVIGDYQELFGKDPDRPFFSVGIFTDSDGTHTASAADFRNVRIYKVARANDVKHP